MRSLIKFILKYHFLILFILIQLLCFSLIVKYNNYHKASFFNSSKSVFAWFYDEFHSITSYFSLKHTNNELLAENKHLYNLLISNYKKNKIKTWEINDTAFSQKYFFNVAEVVNNSVNKQRNYITINAGKKQGIQPEMAVISPAGVVGIIKESSGNYSVVIPLLNKNLSISAKLKKSNYFGSVSWSGEDYRKCTLNEIPFHVDINTGDTIVTSGYSAIFPKGIMIGTIHEFSIPEGESFYNISVSLSVDFKNLDYVYIINNLLKNEQKELENTIKEND